MNSQMQRYKGWGLGGSQAKSFWHHGREMHYLPGCGCVHPPGSSPNALLLGFVWRLHHVGWSIINSIFSTSLFSREWGFTADNPKLLIMAVSFRWPALIQEPTRSHLIRTKDPPITQEITNFPVSGTRVKEQILKKKKNDTPSTLITQEIIAISRALCQEAGAETNIYFLLSHAMAPFTTQNWKVLGPKVTDMAFLKGHNTCVHQT